MRKSAFILLLTVFASCAFGAGVQVPSQRPGKARSGNSSGRLSLANDVISMSWNTAGGKLTPLSITDRLHGKTWRQRGCDMFHIARGATPAEVRYDDLHIGMRIRARRIDVMVSRDGKSWRNVYQHDVYGYASWSPRKGVLTLRNPDDAAQTFDLDIQKVFELPAEAPRKYQLKNAYPDQKLPETVLVAGKTHTLKLRAFEVLVFDVEPLSR